jgi:hypothetical protein
MSLITAYLLREPTEVKLEPNNTRHTESLKCGWCNETYILEYESSCTDHPRDLACILEGAQRVVTEQQHFSGHRDAKVVVANTTPYFAESA